MRRVHKHGNKFSILPALACAVLLAGCAGEGVQLEGKLFEMAGLTGKKDKKDAKVPTRPGLVLPPKVAELPEPGPTHLGVPQESWPDDPDLLRKRRLAEVKKKAEYHREHGDLNRRDGMQGFRDVFEPLNRRKGLLSTGKRRPTTSSAESATSGAEADSSPDITERMLNGDDIRTRSQRMVDLEIQERAAAARSGTGSTWTVSADELRQLEESDSPDITDGFIPKW